MKAIQEFKDTLRDTGFKGVFKRYGWKILVVFFIYYLIRDIILYILIPYLVYRGFSVHS